MPRRGWWCDEQRRDAERRLGRLRRRVCALLEHAPELALELLDLAPQPRDRCLLRALLRADNVPCAPVYADEARKEEPLGEMMFCLPGPWTSFNFAPQDNPGVFLLHRNI